MLDCLHIPHTLEFQVVDRHDGLDIPEELAAVEFVLEMHRISPSASRGSG